ncbi:MAG: amidohydrolase family protein, partial [Haliea sp.]
AEIAWVPTLQVLAMSARAQDAGFRNDPRLKYIPWPIREGMWKPDADNAAKKSRLAGHAETYEQLYQLARRNLVDAHEAGVELLVGTDAGDSYIFPGFSVHDELREFVEAGISAADTLRLATLGAATFSGLDHQYGSIEEGKAADILLLNDNPLANIEATRDIYGLLFNGQFFNRAALDELLSFAEQQSNGVQFNLKLLWSLVSSPIVRMQFAD